MSGHSSSDSNDLQLLTRPYDSLGDSVIVADKDAIILYANPATTSLFGYAVKELLGKPIAIFAPEGESHVDFDSIMKAPNQLWKGEVPRVRKDGTEFLALLTITPFKDLSGEIVGRVGIARDLTNLKEAENSLKKLSRQQSVLAEIGRIVGSTLDIDEVYERFAKQVQLVIPHDRISIGLIESDGEYLRSAYVDGIDVPNRRRGDRLALKGSHAAVTLKLGAGTISSLNEPRYAAQVTPGMRALIEYGIQSLVFTPLIVDGGPIGVLYIYSL